MLLKIVFRSSILFVVSESIVLPIFGNIRDFQHRPRLDLRLCRCQWCMYTTNGEGSIAICSKFILSNFYIQRSYYLFHRFTPKDLLTVETGNRTILSDLHLCHLISNLEESFSGFCQRMLRKDIEVHAAQCVLGCLEHNELPSHLSWGQIKGVGDLGRLN